MLGEPLPGGLRYTLGTHEEVGCKDSGAGGLAMTFDVVHRIAT